MKKSFVTLALGGLLLVHKTSAISLDDIQLWAGSGTNRAALVIEWSVPESLTNSTVPVPVTDKTLVWGYRFNGTATGTQMRDAILAADPKLYFVESVSDYGAFVEGIGYNLTGNGVIGITDGSSTNYITNGLLTKVTVHLDDAHALNSGDLYWGGISGANWEAWNETGSAGGFLSSPDRSTNAYWTVTDTNWYSAGYHGQWSLAQSGLDGLQLTNGSWVGFSVAAGEYEPDANAPYNAHKHAPVSPDGTYVAYVCNTNDFAVEIDSTNNVDSAYPYNDPNAMLGRPTLKFYDGGSMSSKTNHRTKIVEAAYWTDPVTKTNGVITKIDADGQVTVKLGRKIYDDPNNPYGVDLIVYGNSFFSANGFTGVVGDATDLDTANLIGNGSFNGHATTVSVSQDGENWLTFTNTQSLYPDNAYRWDSPNHSWTAEELNPTKPLNPFIYTNNLSGQPVANALDQFTGAAGGSGYDLKAVGLPWIQYVRISPGPDAYTVVDAIAAANPVAVGDTLSISPDNLAGGITNLVFQSPGDATENLISINFNSLDQTAKISTVSLHEFSSFTPVVGNVSSAYQLQARSLTDTNAVALQANVSLRVGDNYSGNGSDLRVYQWDGANWISQSFTFNPANNQVLVAGVTNFSAFVISQIVPPSLSAQASDNGIAFQFTPVANCTHVLERSTDLVTWTPIYTNAPTSAQPVTWQAPNAPADKAFYRVLVNLP